MNGNAQNQIKSGCLYSDCRYCLVLLATYNMLHALTTENTGILIECLLFYLTEMNPKIFAPCHCHPISAKSMRRCLPKTLRLQMNTKKQMSPFKIITVFLEGCTSLTLSR